MIRQVLSALGVELRATKVDPKHPRDPGLVALFGLGTSSTGIVVTPESSLRVMAVYSAVRLIAETVASLPLHFYRRRPDGGKDRATDIAAARLFTYGPNPFQTPFDFVLTLVFHLLLRGNAYAEIVMRGDGQPDALIPLHPDRVRAFFAPDGRRAYEYTPPTGRSRILLSGEVLHVHGIAPDGLKGLNPIELAREGLAVALSAETFGSRLFANGARPGGVLMTDKQLSDEAAKRLREDWELRHSGPQNAGRTAVLEEGLKFEPIGIDPADAQFLETRKFQVQEIARLFRVPPHMIGDLDKATYSNIEMQSLEFVIYSLRPWLVNIEQAIRRDVLTPGQRVEHFAEFKVEGLLRGDTKSRFEAYAVGRNWGWLSVDDIRALENLNPLPDGKGSVYLQPLNMTPAGEFVAGSGGSPDRSAPPPGQVRQAPAPVPDLRAILDAAAERIATKEVRALAKLDPDDDGSDFFARHAAFVVDALAVDPDFAADYVVERHAQFAAAEDRAALLDRWQSEKGAALADAVAARATPKG